MRAYKPNLERKTYNPQPSPTQNSLTRIRIEKNVIIEINFRIGNSSPFLNHYIEIPINDVTKPYDFEFSSTDFQ